MIEETIQKLEIERDKYPYKSENWNFYQNNINTLREEIRKQMQDERYSYRGFNEK